MQERENAAISTEWAAPRATAGGVAVRPWPALFLLVAAHGALLSWSAVRMSVTVDEYAHLPAGLAYLKYGEWSIYHQSPPLLRLWSAWPALLAGANVPPASRYRDDPPAQRYWNYADEYALLNRDRYHRLLVLARLPMVALSCAGVVLAYAVAQQVLGRGGLLAAGLYAFCPNLAAHGSIVGTDTGTAVLMLAAAWAWVRLAMRPTAATAVLAGAALAATLLAKFSSVLLLPTCAAAVAWGTWRAEDRRRAATALVPGAAAALVLALVLVNLCYGYHGSFRPIGQYQFDSAFVRAAAARLPAWTPVPLPRDFVLGFDAAKWEIEQPFQAFLLGRTYRGTDPWYYPVAVATKLPLGTLGIIALASASLAYRRPSLRHPEAPLWATLLILILGIVAGATVNIGVRYLLPALPIAFVLCARLVGVGRSPWRLAPWGLLAVVVVENLSVAPRYLTFFNVAAGGPTGGQSILNDSNVDWGQGLIDLRTWMTSNGVGRVQLAYFGRVDPAVYGVQHAPLSAMPDEAGAPFIAVSSYYRAGLAYRMPIPGGGRTDFLALPFADALRSRCRPVAVVGNVIWIYDRADVIRAIKSRDNVR